MRHSTGSMPIARYARDVLLFAPCYVALDWASYSDALGPFNITPWNPQPALAIAWMALAGLHYAPAVFATIGVAELLVRATPGGVALTLLTSAILAGGYAWIAYLLRMLLPEPSPRSTRELTVFAIVALAGTALVGAAFIGALRGAGMLADTPVLQAWLRFWIGDAVGVLVTAPLLLAVADPLRRAALVASARKPESWAQAGALVIALWLIFKGLPGDPSHHFYLLFVPLIWIAVRGGLAGAVMGTTIVQLGVVLGIHGDYGSPLPVFELQALVAALSLTGLYLGMIVDERQRAAEDLRQTLRLAAAGEMAAAIAHELNQPLTALGNYARAARTLLSREAERSQVDDVVGRMLGESERAAEVVRRLRDFFRDGTTRLEPVMLGELVAAARRNAEQLIGEQDIVLEVREEASSAPVLVDRVQVDLVLRNLVANAVDSLRLRREPGARVEITARQLEGRRVRIGVSDNGAGMAPATRARLFEPFVSAKSTGMGLGLAVSRAIAEAHGGTLTSGAGAHGEFFLELPCGPET